MSRAIEILENLPANQNMTPVKASSSDYKKGEVYVVHDGSAIVVYKDKPLNNLTRKSATEIAAQNDKWVVASSSFAFDKGIK